MIARILDYSARNRFLVLLGTGFAALAAVWAVRTAKLDAIPDLSDPQVVVFTEWMGRSPTLVEDQITYPIVSSLVAAPHVTDVRGYSMFGMSFIHVVFEEGTDLYWARSRVLEYLNGLGDRLPEGASPVLGPDATGIGWVFQYTLVDTTKRHGLDELRAFQDFTLRYALGSVPGVAEVASLGGHQKQYQVTVDPAKLRAYGVTLGEVTAAIRDSNDDVGGSVLEMSGREYYVRGRGYLGSLADLEATAVRGGAAGAAPVLVRDVGQVRFGPDIRRGLLEWNGEGEAVGAIVVMRHGENALEVIDRVKAKLAELKPSFPAGVEVAIAYDRSDLIGRSIATLRHALVEEMIVVSLVIVLFLLHIRSSLLAILTLPLAVGLAFIPMRLLGIPSTIMSLGGIAIAIGATVDAVIVMIEAAHKKLEHAPPGANRQALLAEAAREVTPAIFFSLLIIAVAFLPVFALTGQAGRLFQPLAYTKTFVMLFSALLSITLAPALRDFLIRGRIFAEERHPVSRAIIAVYRPFVWVALRNPRSTVAIGLFAVLSAVPLATKLGHEFMPPLNEGDVLYMPITFPNISIEEAKRQLQRQDQVLRSFPEVASVFGKIGRAESATDPAPLTMVETTVRLKPPSEWRTVYEPRWYSAWAPDALKPVLARAWPEERPWSWDELTAEMNRTMQFPGWTNAWTMPIKTRVDMLTTGVRTPIGIKVLGDDLDEIERIGTQLEGLIAPIAGTRSVLYERNLGGLYLDIVPKREALARYGLRIGDVERVIEAAIGGAPVTTTIEGRQRFSVNVRYPRDLRGNLEELRQVLVPIGGERGTTPGSMGGGEMGPTGALGPGVLTPATFMHDSPVPDRLAPGMLTPAAFVPVAIVPGALVPDATREIVLAQTMPMPSGGDGLGGAPLAPARPGSNVMTDAVMNFGASPMPMGAGSTMAGAAMTRARAITGSRAMGGPMPTGARSAPMATGRGFVPLGQIADIRITSGPPMVRDENGQLAGYVYVDIDTGARDIGGYVDEAKAAVADAIARGELTLRRGTFLEWTGQYELLEQMAARMKIVVPITILIVIVLLYLQFQSVAEVLIVLLSIPFALVGSAWLLWLLDYRLSTAVWVGVIALVGLAAQTGIVMIVYIDHALDRRRREGKLHDLADIIDAHMEGTVQRVRPKLMTVATMLVGLVPLLWATGSGADVMKRIAAPMVGGLLTSAFLTLEIIPVISTYWRHEQLLWERLAPLDPLRLARLRTAAAAQWWGWGLLAAIGASLVYVQLPPTWLRAALALGATLAFGGLVAYAAMRPAAKRVVWPARA